MDLVDDQAASACVRCGGKHLQGLPGYLVLGIVGIIGPGEQHFSRFDETAQVVHMAVGFVHVHPFIEPDHLVHIQVGLQQGLDLFPGQMGIAVAVEQAFLRGDQGALAVHVKRTAFHDQRAPGSGRSVRSREPLPATRLS